MRWKTSYFCILSVSPPRIILLNKQNQTWDSILTQKLKLNNYSCCQKSTNDDHLGQGGWILIPNETPDKTPPGFHLKWNMFFISDQILSCLLFRLRRLVKKKGGGVRASSRFSNTYDLVLSSVFRCLEPVMKHLPSCTSLSYTASWSAATESPGFSLLLGVAVTSNSLVKLCGIRRFPSRCFLFFTAAHNLSKKATTQLNH